MINYNNYVYNDNEVPKEEEVCISIDGKTWLTYGNFSVFTGKPKSRKSFIGGLGVLMAHHTGQEVFNLKVNTAGKVIYIDTEQRHYNFYKSLQRVKNYLNVEKLDPGKFKAYLFRMLETEEILDNIELILMSESDIKILILDSITDLVNDINNIIEAKALISRFKKWSGLGISVVCILHQAKTASYALGHIGSFCERAAESMNVIEKSSEDPFISTCKSLYMRSDIDFKDYSVNFSQDTYDIQEPVSKLSNKNINPDLIDMSIHNKNLTDISLIHSKLSYQDLTKCLQSRYGKGETYVKRQLIPYLRDKNLVSQDDNKKYIINKTLNTNKNGKEV